MAKRSDCDLSTAGSVAPSLSGGTGVTSLALSFKATDCSCRRGGHEVNQTDRRGVQA